MIRLDPPSRTIINTSMLLTHQPKPIMCIGRTQTPSLLIRMSVPSKTFQRYQTSRYSNESSTFSLRLRIEKPVKRFSGPTRSFLIWRRRMTSRITILPRGLIIPLKKRNPIPKKPRKRPVTGRLLTQSTILIHDQLVVWVCARALLYMCMHLFLAHGLLTSFLQFVWPLSEQQKWRKCTNGPIPYRWWYGMMVDLLVGQVRPFSLSSSNFPLLSTHWPLTSQLQCV